MSNQAERNRIQNLFLEENNIKKLMQTAWDRKVEHTCIYTDCGVVHFEGMCDWDLVMENYEWDMCNCNDPTIESCNCEVNKKFKEKFNIPYRYSCLNLPHIFCEIQPVLGDEYPNVLKKMKKRMELTKKYIEKKNKELEEECHTQYEPCHRAYIRNKYSIRPQYVLLVKDFISEVTTKDQLKQIFDNKLLSPNDCIKVIFLNEIVNELNTSKIIQVEQREYTELEKKVKELEIQLKQLKKEIQKKTRKD